MHKLMALALLVVIAIAGFAMPGTARAEELDCRTTLGAITVDNLRVPQGATCTLQGTVVQGTIVVETNATLRASGVRVVGNVQAENARRVNVTAGSQVGGSIQIVQGGAAQILNTRVNGDILFDDNSGLLVAKRNTLGGNLQAFQNTGGVTIERNTIDGNLQCKENVPAPTGFGNIVQGSKEDQCAGL